MRADSLRTQWATTGYLVTDDDVEKARRRVAGLPPISDEKHARNADWLARFDADATPA
jgi:hypothetical protein